MNGVLIFLFAEAALWIPYGIYCLFVPTVLADGATVLAQSPTGTTELRAMYGGLQIAIGVSCLLGAFVETYRTSALYLLLVVGAGIGLGRLLGVLLDGSPGAYTLLALAFEFVTAVVAARLLSRARS